jgi:hypothetical protein
VIFPRSIRLLDFELKSIGAPEHYYQKNWERSESPLLDALGAIACQTVPEFADVPESFATSCNWCFNADARVARPGPISERDTWDGFAGIFTVLAHRYKSKLTDYDRDWVKALSDE